MSADWQEVTFGEVFHISSSKRVVESQWTSSGVPFYRAREVVKLSKDGAVSNDLFISEELYSKLKEKSGAPESGDLIVSAVGTLGACYVVQPNDEFYFKDASVLWFKPKKKISSRFIWHTFQTNSIREQINSGSGSTVGTYTIARANQTQLVLPPLAEQYRIAAILDKADALRTNRREAIAKLDQLLQSIFLEMFGDPVTNPKCRVVELASLCERVTDGTHQSPEWSETGVPFLFQSNVKPGEINFETKKSISFEEYKALTARCPIEYGDVLYTIVGSYGNAAMVKTHEKFCFQRHIAHLKPKAHVLPEFLEAMMNHPSVKRQADERVTGVAQKTLILKELKRLLVVEPSMEQQMQFRAVSQHISESRKAMVESAVKLSDEFNAIQNAAFSGAF